MFRGTHFWNIGTLRLLRSQGQRPFIVVVALIVSLSLLGCSSSASREEAKIASPHPALLTPEQCEANAAIQKAALYTDTTSLIQPGDQLAIDFYLSPEFSTKVTVGLDGNVSLPVAGVVHAAGLTPAQFAAVLDKAYEKELREPNATVHIIGTPGRQVYIGGEVMHPGAFPLLPGMTALQAIVTAGGFTEYANKKKVLLVRRDACGIVHSEILNLQAAMAHPDSGEDATLASRDLVLVTPKKIQAVNQWARHYIQNMVPFSFEPYMMVPAP